MRIPRIACAALLLLSLQSLKAQYYIDPPKDHVVYVIDGVHIGDDAPVFDREPNFPGGRIELFRFLEANIPLTGPAQAEAALGGEALLLFALDAAGRVGEAAVVRTNTPSLEFILLRAIEKMPDWEPAVVDGMETAVLVYLPLFYRSFPGGLIMDESTQKAIVGRQPANWWLKAGLLVGAVGLFAALFFGLR